MIAGKLCQIYPSASEPNDEVGTSRRPNGRAAMSVASLNPSVKDLRRLAELRAAHESSLEAEKVAAQRSEVLEAALADRDERIGHLEAQLVEHRLKLGPRTAARGAAVRPREERPEA